MNGPVMIMAGGTGGHVFPALAVARVLRERDYGVVWLGGTRGLENELVPAAGYPLEHISVAGVRGKGALTWVLAPLSIARAVLQALRILRRARPRVVLGMGGYASGPGGLAAWLLRKPLLIHEQNAVAGLTNRLLAGFAREVLEAFPGSFSGRKNATTVGNPIRREIAELPMPAQRMAGRHGAVRVLVLGGSQGALFLNEKVPEVLAAMRHGPVEVRHQTGAGTAEAARVAYKKAGVEVRIETFIDDMASAYGWADIVVCRSGALTVSELSGAGLAAVLVPLPGAVDDHQTRNAEFLEQLGAARIVQQADFDAVRVAGWLDEWCQDRAALVSRAENARRMARPDATDALVEACLRWVDR